MIAFSDYGKLVVFFLNNVQPEDDDEVDIVSIYSYVVVHA